MGKGIKDFIVPAALGATGFGLAGYGPLAGLASLGAGGAATGAGIDLAGAGGAGLLGSGSPEAMALMEAGMASGAPSLAGMGAIGSGAGAGGAGINLGAGAFGKALASNGSPSFINGIGAMNLGEKVNGMLSGGKGMQSLALMGALSGRNQQQQQPRMPEMINRNVSPMPQQGGTFAQAANGNQFQQGMTPEQLKMLYFQRVGLGA